MTLRLLKIGSMNTPRPRLRYILFCLAIGVIEADLVQQYYVTLDLTVPGHQHKGAASRKEMKRSFKTKWLNPNSQHLQRDNSPEENGTPTADAQPDLDDVPRSPEGSGNDGELETASKVQILGLHDKNPMVLYKGTIYSCRWASNIGTELLFTEHDPNSALPVLRHLPGNVDLLAASSSRIISSTVHVDPKHQSTEEPQRKRRKVASGKDPALMIPVGVQASDKRKNQAKFLQRLMEIKEDKGEEDEVTVYTLKKFSRVEWRAHLAQQRDDERSKMEKTVQKNKSAVSVQKAMERLTQLDREDEKAREIQEQWLLESKQQGTSRTRMKGRERTSHDVKLGADNYGTPRADGISYRATRPKATPQRWEMEGDGDEDEDEDEEDDDDLDDNMEDYQVGHDEDMAEEFYNEDVYGNEDAEGVDEDTQGAYEWS